MNLYVKAMNHVIPLVNLRQNEDLLDFQKYTLKDIHYEA